MASSSSRGPCRGPAPLLLTPKEVDALYDCLEAVHAALLGLCIPHLLVAGSLLGAVRSQSILFCDDDVDIAVFEEDYPRLLQQLPAALAPHATYVRRPWPAADRVRPRALPHVWVDVFVLRRYDSMEQLRRQVSMKDNGQPQPDAYVDAILRSISGADAAGAPLFPLWHYDTRKALELWPEEFFTAPELLPLRHDYRFGHLTLPGPAHPAPALRRALGADVFQVYKLALSHAPRCKELRGRLEAHQAEAQPHEDRGLQPGGGQGEPAAPAPGAAVPLADEQFIPMQHSRRCKRVESSHCRAALTRYLQQAAEAWDQLISSPGRPAVPGLTTTTTAPGATAMNTTVKTTVNSAMNTVMDKDKALPRAFDLDPADGNRDASSGHAGSGGALPPPKPSWFGAAVRHHTRSSPLPLAFTPELLAVMEPHLHKARALRTASTDTAPLPPSFHVLSQEVRGEYDAAAHALGPALAAALGLPAAADLSQLHLLAPPLGGKQALMARLLSPLHREPFHRAFDAFVRAVVAPHVAAALGPRAAPALRFQSFPCVRVIQPGEFSLGPHCDAAYGHAAANLNFVVPLTPPAGAAALHLESSPGAEDWHPVAGGPGTFTRFLGSRCLHWTSENSTACTRVSLDFRVVPGEFWDADADAFCRQPGYYVLTTAAAGGSEALSPAPDNPAPASGGSNTGCAPTGSWEQAPTAGGVGQPSSSSVWLRDGELPCPDRRMGYPFT